MVNITYFVHGTTTDNEQDLATGWLPGQLSETGKRQSKELAGMVANQVFDVVFCSDLKRALESAVLAFGGTHKIVPDERLRECNYGDFNGHPTPLFKSNMVDYVEHPFPNGESYRDVEKRMAEFIKFLAANYTGKKVAIVSHQGPQLALDVLLSGKT